MRMDIALAGDIDITSDFVGRVYAYRNGVTGGFTARYHLHRLVWFEAHDNIISTTASHAAKCVAAW